jgi:arylsulfatase A-like enzyme
MSREGYTGFSALYGNYHVQPVISPTGPVVDLDGNIIQTAKGNPGFPNIFNPLATQSLGYAAAMLEAGVQVVYVYISDAHDNHAASGTFGPGQAEYVAQLKSYDTAFGQFFARLKADGITTDNTLFLVTADENDHFAGGPPSPANCDGVTLPCTYAKIGEVDTLVDRLLLTQKTPNATPFDIHFDSAPNFYIHGNPGPSDSLTRTMEHDVNGIKVLNPISNQFDKLSVRLADQAEMKLLHMVTSVADRTPTFTMFGNPDYFNETASSSSQGQGMDCSHAPPCVFEAPGFAWNHGDFQNQITRTWFGLAGPGVKKLGRFDTVFSDHADLRPTILELIGLHDDYIHDGRVLAEILEPNSLPHSLRKSLEDFIELAQLYKEINAPRGTVGRKSLLFANKSIVRDDKTYAIYLATIEKVTDARNDLAGEIIALLNAAEFENQSLGEEHAENLVRRAKRLIEKVEDLVGDPRE